jgi:arylsulfatase A-like enzyme
MMACVAIWAFPIARAQQPGPSSKPNVVLIVSDDHAWTDYGFMQHPVVKTPNIDALAASSLTFSRGYVTSSLCCPSLATMITGRYPHQHKITCNDPPKPADMPMGEFAQTEAFKQGRARMSQHLTAAGTLPTMLKSHGYRSLQTGKWWQGSYDQGGFTEGMTKGGRHGDTGLDIGRKTMEPITKFLDDCKTTHSPFLVWYAPMMPHDPHTPPQRLLDKYIDKTPSIHVARYWAMVEWFDETVGELMESLRKRSLLENTIVVYIADNGWIQDPESPRYAPRSKQSQFDGGLRTPIMVHWQGKIAPKMSSDLAQSIDIVPTLMAALGLPKNDQMPGINLMDESAVANRKTIFGSCFTHNAVDLDQPSANLRWRWMIDGSMKAIFPDSKNEPHEKPSLFDLASDPKEQVNLAEKEPHTLSELSNKIDKWWKP